MGEQLQYCQRRWRSKTHLFLSLWTLDGSDGQRANLHDFLVALSTNCVDDHDGWIGMGFRWDWNVIVWIYIICLYIYHMSCSTCQPLLDEFRLAGACRGLERLCRVPVISPTSSRLISRATSRRQWQTESQRSHCVDVLLRTNSTWYPFLDVTPPESASTKGVISVNGCFLLFFVCCFCSFL